jgi:IS30 family transposase
LVSTASERVEVERLLAEGMPIRAVAEQVFGEARFRGRVERIVERRRTQDIREPRLTQMPAYVSGREVDRSPSALRRLLEQLQQPVR